MQDIISPPHPYLFSQMLLLISSQHSNTIIIILLLFLITTTWCEIWPCKLSNPYLQNVHHTSSFLGILLTMWEPWWPPFLWNRSCHTHIFLLSFFGGGIIIYYLFCTPCHTRGAQICNPTLDTMRWLQGGRVLCPVVLTLDSQESFFVDSHASCLSVCLWNQVHHVNLSFS